MRKSYKCALCLLILLIHIKRQNARYQHVYTLYSSSGSSKRSFCTYKIAIPLHSHLHFHIIALLLIKQRPYSSPKSAERHFTWLLPLFKAFSCFRRCFRCQFKFITYNFIPGFITHPVTTGTIFCHCTSSFAFFLHIST